jgi:hypothetical protein
METQGNFHVGDLTALIRRMLLLVVSNLENCHQELYICPSEIWLRCSAHIAQ